MNVSAFPLPCRFARSAVLLALTSALSGPASAVVNPALEEDATPVVLDCFIFESTSAEVAAMSTGDVRCLVLEVVRSQGDIQKGDVVSIVWQVNRAELDRQWSEMRNKQASNPGWAGPAPETAPVAPAQGSFVTAYLRLASGDSYPFRLTPNLGMDSFRPAKSYDAGPCGQPDEGPILSRTKECSEAQMVRSEAVLTIFVERRLAVLKEMAEGEDNETIRLTYEKSVELMHKSQEAWFEYRDATCTMAYYQYYPGSMARLIGSECRRTLTDERFQQLRKILLGEDEPMS